MIFDSSLLRILWSVVEEINLRDLLTLSDTALAALLLRQVSRRVLLSGTDQEHLHRYIGTKIHLIRDMAENRS
jgi:hypothetical protein